MSKKSVITIRVDSKLKQNAETVLNQLGLTTTQAITLFLHQVELQRDLPFQVKIPNQTMLQVIEEAKNQSDLDIFQTTNELYEDIGI